MPSRILAVVLLILFAASASAAPKSETTGGDLYISGSGSSTGISAGRDLFAAGGTVAVSGEVAQDAHFAGADVDIETDVSGDVYAAGGSATVRGEIGGDLTAAAFSLRVAPSSSVAGNTRLAGVSIVIDGPIAGAAVISGGEVIVNAEIGGDARIYAGKLSFGSGARIGGTLEYSAPEEIEIPDSVIAADRVRFEKFDRMEAMREATRDWNMPEYPAMPSFLGLFAGLLITIGFFVVLAAIALSVWPERIEAMRQTALARPGIAFLAGVLGLAVAFGLVPISLMTIVGIPLLPVVLLAIVILWTLGYAFGVYVVALRVWEGMGGQEPTMPGRLVVLAAGILVVAMLNVIPFIGWIINFTLVLFGIGAISEPVFERLFGPGERPADT